MALLLSYCLKLSLSLVLIWLFYQVVLRKLTFYNWNRYYLLGYSLLSFFVAFIDISPVLQQTEWSDTHVMQWIPVLSETEIVPPKAATENFFTPANIAGLLLITGTFVMFVRLLFQFVSFIRLKKRAELIAVDGMKFYQVNDSITPFSFGNSIFINRHLHTENEMTEIIRHEFVHVRQNHSVDIIWAEVLCILNWYNPFAWLIRASIRQNLEFIADNKVLATGISKKEYQYLLLKVIGNNQFSIAPNFNFSSLKKRIAMMNKLKSARMNLVRFLFGVPLVTAMLLAFRSGRMAYPPDIRTVVSSSNGAISSFGRQAADTVPSKKSVKSPNSNNQKNPSNSCNDFEITEDKAVMHLKDGTTEIYDLQNKDERQQFEDKYGKIISVNSDYHVVNSPSAINADFDITDDRAIVHLKNGTTEQYDLKDKEQRKNFQEKYGIISVDCIVQMPPTTAVTPVTSVSVATEGIANAVSPVNVVSNVNSSVATSTSVCISKMATPANVATIIASPHVTSTNDVVVDDDGSILNGKEEILIIINKNTTRQQLEEYRKQMKEKDIELNFDEIGYDDKGSLTRLTGTMESKDGNRSFSATGFNKLILSVVKDGSHSYFRVRTTNNKEVI